MKRKVVSSVLATFLLGSLSIAACGGGDDDGPTDFEPTGPISKYASNTIEVPDSPADGSRLGFDLDNDNKTDNALGGILGALATTAGDSVDISGTVQGKVADGSLVILHSIQADDLATDPTVEWKVYLGEELGMAPKFDGTDVFTQMASSTPGSLKGAITGGKFSGGPGEVTIQLALSGGDPITVNLVGARLEAKVTADGCTEGKLGGAITKEELNNSVIPGVADLINESVNNDGLNDTLQTCTVGGPACPDAPNGGGKTTCDAERLKCITSTSKSILDIFDRDNDAVVTAQEVANANLIKAFLEPDVDVLDGTELGQDGVDESLSLGLGFTCAKAGF